MLYLHGPAGSGKQNAAAALSAEQGRGFLRSTEKAAARLETDAFEDCVRRSIRESRLQHAALYWDGFDSLLTDEKRSAREMLIAELRNAGELSFLAGDAAWEPSFGCRRHSLPQDRIPAACFRRTPADVGVRFACRAGLGNRHGCHSRQVPITGEQIRAAAATAGSLALWRNPASPQITIQDLYEACRLHSNRKLATLARKIKPRYAWDDIILHLTARVICGRFAIR